MRLAIPGVKNVMKKSLWAVSVLLFLPLALSAAGPAQDNPDAHLFILSGQSNMRGPLPETFKSFVSKVFGEDHVIVVTHAHPSQPIRRWYKKWTPPKGIDPDEQVNGNLYDALLAKVKKAIEGKHVASVTFIWMQGEADAEKGWGAVYAKSFLGILDQFKDDLGCDEITFVLGRINDHYLTSLGTEDGDLVRSVQQKLGEDHRNGDWVNTDDLNRGVNPWGVYSLADGHFPPAGYRVLGERFAAKACKLIDPDVRIDDRCFAARFIHSPRDIKTHAAVGKTAVTATSSEPGQGAPAHVQVLTDGQYGSTDPDDRQWVRCPPETESVEWVIDMGEEMDVTSLAASVLVNRDAVAGFPVNLGFAVSSDGTDYQPLIRRRNQTAVKFGYRDKMRFDWNRELEPQSALVLIEKAVKARYIKLTAKTAESWLFIDEIAVNPVPGPTAVRAIDSP